MKIKSLIYKNHISGLKRLRFIFRSLRYRNYCLFFIGQSISVIGTWIQRIAMPWLVYRLTSSAFLLGVVGFTSQIPIFLLAPFAGVLCERWNRHSILIVTQILAMIQALALAFFFFIGNIEIWHIIVLGILLGCINAFDTPARHSFVVEMVENKEDLGNAIALNSSMFNSARLLGPSIAGVLIAVTNEGICFFLNGLSYIFVIVSLLMMKPSSKVSSKVSSKEITAKNTQVLQELKEGFSYTFGFAPTRAVIILLSLVSLFGMSYTVLMPVFAKEILNGGSHIFGLLMGASGIGALISSLYLASRKSVFGIEKIIPIAAAIFGFGLIALSLSRIFLLSFTFMLITGFGMIMQTASSNTILQTIVDDNKRARLMSFYTMAFMGTAPFGSLLAGGLANILGVPNTLTIAGVVCILGAVVFARKLSNLRKIIRPIYVRLGVIPEVASGIQTATELTVQFQK